MIQKSDGVSFDWAGADRAYTNYVENCLRLGAEPMSRERAKTLMSQWADALSAGPTHPAQTD